MKPIHWAASGAMVACLTVCAWFLTAGSWDLWQAEQFGSFYDDQARSLLHGHWDVTPQSIGGEAFVLGGRYYGYFGFLPAIPRIALNAAMPNMFGRAGAASACY